MTPSTASTTQRPCDVRVVSYNVLSSHLASPSHFSTLNPDHLAAKNRLPVVLDKIQEEMSNRAVICLQEVSYTWAGSFHTQFANHGYHFVTSLYGKKFNNYMGVGIAIPTNKYKVVNVDICRLSDKKMDGWPRAPKDTNFGFLHRILTTVKATIRRVLELIRIVPDSKQLEWNDPWNIAEYRSNAMVTMTLQDKETEKCFVIGNYHMPCCFYAPPVMTLHVDLAAKHVETLATTQQQQPNTSNNENENEDDNKNETDRPLPYIVAGDWNIKPDSSQYRLLTTGQMDVGDPDWPSPKHGMVWKPSAKPLSSAYQLAQGTEPNFTNYARVGEQEPFIDTLDYIFLSQDDNNDSGDKWTVKGVKSLPHRDEAGGPFPNLDRGEPSDHVLIAADLELN
ncbi:endonuclease/exonuclease/phosphatase family protein [Nitzschia inconspicua]|uniref:Endonuclease/exonuclease/phosphatase family protein n=1 Tax=Nitzschia inconspicua TaxID=303405 RepID=A0A9K3PUN7_9STRA|nr:endonuclease/exonuclease/phosphatase family protein [Nitzschia inconspicua]